MSDAPPDDFAEPLPEELEELVRAERTRPELADGRARALRERVDRALDAASVRQGAPSPSRAAVPSALWFAAGAALGVLVAWAMLRAPVPAIVVSQTVVINDAARDGSDARSLEAPLRTAPVATSPWVATAPRDASVDALGADVLRSARARTTAQQADDDDDALERERSLVEAARSAVARGAFAAALGAVREHERDFPRGRLAEERDALRVVALARSGHREEAWGRAQVFLRRYPESLSRAQVEALVAPPR